MVIELIYLDNEIKIHNGPFDLFGTFNKNPSIIKEELFKVLISFKINYLLVLNNF